MELNVNSFKKTLTQRPWWLNIIWLFCLYMTFIYMPFDMFTKPYAQWEEVWFGVQLTGWPAKLTEPLHWFIYGAGSYGIWKMKSWMWPWAAVYSAQIVIAMFVFSLLERGLEDGLVGAVVAAALFSIPTVALWRARSLFQASK